MSTNARELIEEIQSLCRAHGLSLAHEDEHGAFRVVKWNKVWDEALMQAIDETDQPKEKE